MNTATTSIDVILVDDSAITLMLLKDILINAGFNVLAAVGTGKGLEKALKKYHPHVIVLDHHLPDCLGLDLLRVIKNTRPEIAVVMITLDDTVELENAARALGAEGFIHKPFVGQQVIQKVNFAVARIRQQGRTAVIADDSPAMRAVLNAILTELGIKVLAEAENGEQVCQLVQDHLPSLVFLDIEMPVKTGIEALANLNQLCPQIRKVMITASPSLEYVQKAVQNGAAGFIVKPFDSKKIAVELKRILPN